MSSVDWRCGPQEMFHIFPSTFNMLPVVVNSNLQQFENVNYTTTEDKHEHLRITSHINRKGAKREIQSPDSFIKSLHFASF